MPIDQIIVPLHGENTASQGEFFLRGHKRPSGNCSQKNMNDTLVVSTSGKQNTKRSPVKHEWKSCTLSAHDEVHFAIQDLKQRHELIDGLLVVGLIEKPIELSRGRAEPANNLALGQWASGDPSLRL